MSLRKFACLMALTCLIWVVPARADVVTDWDAIAVQAIVNAGALHPSGTGILDWAMVHVAVHDAVQSYERRFEPYLGLVPGASRSPIAAVAAAAHDILVHQFPAQTASLNMTVSELSHEPSATFAAERPLCAGGAESGGGHHPRPHQ